MMPTIDVAAYTGVFVIVLWAVVFGLLVYLRDPAHVAPHAVSRVVWCPQHERQVLVEFTERVQTGLAVRRVRHCPLRGPGERCGERCAWKETV